MRSIVEEVADMAVCGAVAEFLGKTYTCNRAPHSGMKMHRDGLANGGVGQEWPKIAGVPWTGDGIEDDSA